MPIRNFTAVLLSASMLLTACSATTEKVTSDDSSKEFISHHGWQIPTVYYLYNSCKKALAEDKERKGSFLQSYCAGQIEGFISGMTYVGMTITPILVATEKPTEEEKEAAIAYKFIEKRSRTMCLPEERIKNNGLYGVAEDLVATLDKEMAKAPDRRDSDLLNNAGYGMMWLMESSYKCNQRQK